jgi:F-type H+-transporting ATPase subunit alpha
VQHKVKLSKKLGGGVRLDLAQYRELAAFAQFSSDLDESTRRQLERGQRITELMKQPQYHPMPVADMAVTLFSVNQGFLDDVPVKKVVDFERALHSYMHHYKAELVARINEVQEYTPEIESGLRAALTEFKATQSW